MKFAQLTAEGDRKARQLYRRLLITYLGVTASVFLIAAILLYLFVSKSLYRQLTEDLKVLAEAAAPSLEVANTRSEFFAAETEGEHWHAIEQHQQSLEWFDDQGKLLVREGKLFPSEPLSDIASLDPEGILLQDAQQKLYVVVLPVFKDKKLLGVVRASESKRILEQPLTQLRWGMVIGGGLCLALIGLSALWLSQLAIQPFLQSYQRLRQFTADASHEMRSPLTVLQASADAMEEQREQLSASNQTNLDRIKTASQHLRGLVAALLKLARTDESTTLPMETIPLHELLQDLVEALEVIADEKGVALTQEDGAPVFVKGNNAQLVELFTNLIQNGIKYTPSGGSVSVGLAQKEHQAIVSVTDSGVGIAPEDIPHVFERFWQADKSRSQRVNGFGLGLAIAHDIAIRHGGEISVNSTVGSGSSFEVRLLAIAEKLMNS